MELKIQFKILDIVPGRDTGMKDIDGKLIYDGDRVMDYGMQQNPVEGTVRLFDGYDERGPYWGVITDDNWSTGLPAYISGDSKYGVRKLEK